MDNQHKQIKGYRDLTQAEIDLMNRIKTAGAELLKLQDEVISLNMLTEEKLVRDSLMVKQGTHHDDGQLQAHDDFILAQPHRWASIAKTDIQTGLMALIRAVARPTL